MAVDCFMHFEGPDVAGESKVGGFEEQIDVLAWSWGASQSGTMHVATGGGGGKANVQDLSFTHWVDSSSPNLLQSCVGGTQFDKITLTCRKAGGDAPVDYLIIEMENAIITSVSLGGSGGEDRFTENVSLNFSKYLLTYTPQEDDGTPGTAIGPVGWDIRVNEPI